MDCGKFEVERAVLEWHEACKEFEAADVKRGLTRKRLDELVAERQKNLEAQAK